MKPITIITGHYGSGKSEFSLNLAINKGVKFLIDLDIVNPYFRSREQEALLEEKGIKLIASPMTNASGSDLPFIAKEVFTPFYFGKNSIIDLGGNDVGARLLQQFKEVMDVSMVDFLICVNVFREETNGLVKIKQMIKSLESSSGLKVTGIINNSNLLKKTTLGDVLYGERIISQLDLPIKYTGIYEKIVDDKVTFLGEIIPLKLYLRKEWM